MSLAVCVWACLSVCVYVSGRGVCVRERERYREREKLGAVFHNINVLHC